MHQPNKCFCLHLIYLVYSSQTTSSVILLSLNTSITCSYWMHKWKNHEKKKIVVLISECTSDCNVTLLHLFSFSQVKWLTAMALRMVTRKLGSKLLPRFSSTSLLHSHATSFGLSFSLSHIFTWCVCVWLFYSENRYMDHRFSFPSMKRIFSE